MMDSGKNVPARPDGARPPQIHTQAYPQAASQGNPQLTPYGNSFPQIHNQAYIHAANQGHQQAIPYGASPPQIQTQAYLQGVNQGNQHPVILLPQQGHPQITSNVSAGRLPTVLMAYTPQARSNTTYEEFKGKQAVVLGGLQLAIGCLAIAMESGGFKMQQKLYYIDYYMGMNAFNVYSSVWCGVFFFIAGGFAIGSGKKKTKCLLVTTAIMEAFSLFFAAVFLGISSWAVAASDENCSSAKYHEREACKKYVKVSQAMAAIMLISSLAQITFSIWQLVLCGKVLCPCGGTDPCCANCCDCCCPTHDQAFMFVNSVSPQNGQLVQVANPGPQPMNFAPAYQMVPPASQDPMHAMGQNQTEGRNITPPPAYDVNPG